MLAIRPDGSTYSVETKRFKGRLMFKPEVADDCVTIEVDGDVATLTALQALTGEQQEVVVGTVDAALSVEPGSWFNLITTDFDGEERKTTLKGVTDASRVLAAFNVLVGQCEAAMARVKWAYHGTHSGVLPQIAEQGLVPELYFVYFSQFLDSGTLYARARAERAGAAPVVLRFPWPADAEPNPDVDVLDPDPPVGEFAIRHGVAPVDLQMLVEGKWRRLP